MIDFRRFGTGEIFLENDLPLRCTFELKQRGDAQLLLDCCCDDPRAGWMLHSAAKDLQLEGITDTGESVRVNCLHILELDGPRCIFAASEATLGSENFAEGEYEFAVTNLIFPDVKRHALPEPIVLSLTDNQETFQVVLRPRADYVDKQAAVRHTKQPAVTAVLQIRSPRPIEDLLQFATDICDALSVIQGSKINWISYTITRPDDTSTVILHNRVTKPYSPLALNQQGGNHERLPLIALNVCFRMLHERKAQLDLDSRIINAWLDARVDTDYLESRALKFVIVVEMLRTIVLRSQPPRRHLDEHAWQHFLTYALPHLEFYLKAGMKCSKEVVEGLMNRNKWENLNRKSFRSDISATLKVLGAKESSRDVELFIQCRNKLIHEGRFRCAAETLSPEDNGPRTPSDEYLFIAGFVDRLILSTFGLNDFTAADIRARSLPSQ